MIRLELPRGDNRPLLEVLSTQPCPGAGPSSGTIGPEKARALLEQGSVWSGNQRWRDGQQPVPPHCWVAWPKLPIVPVAFVDDQIVLEDEHLLVVWKPPQLNTCPSVYSDLDCLSAGVQNYLDDCRTNYTVQTINRLDRDTQGLVFFAKHKAAEIALHGLFMNRQISKRYLVITPAFETVKSRYAIDEPVTWRGKIQSARTLVRRAPALLPVELRATSEAFVVFPQTGRTHQIRQHFAQKLVPIRGDVVYGGAPVGSILQLYCVGYRCRHPITQQRLAVSALSRAIRR